MKEKKCKICGTLPDEINVRNIGKINTRKLCNDCILIYQRCLVKSKRIKKVKAGLNNESL